MNKGHIEAELTRLKSRLAMLEEGPLAHYETNVKLAEKALAKLTEGAKRGQATAEEIADAATNLAKANEQLAAARAAAASSSHERLLGVKEAGSLRANIADQEARLKPLKEQLAKLESPGMAAKLARYRNQQQEDQRLNNEIWLLTERVRALQQTVRERNPVTFTVLDGNPVPEVIPGTSK